MSRYANLMDTLRDAHRYVRSNPEESRRLTFRVIEGLLRCLGDDGYELYCRLRDNLNRGCDFIVSAPDVLAGYITGAILEIQDYEAKNK